MDVYLGLMLASWEYERERAGAWTILELWRCLRAAKGQSFSDLRVSLDIHYTARALTGTNNQRFNGFWQNGWSVGLRAEHTNTEPCHKLWEAERNNYEYFPPSPVPPTDPGRRHQERRHRWQHPAPGRHTRSELWPRQKNIPREKTTGEKMKTSMVTPSTSELHQVWFISEKKKIPERRH